jgi:phosphatidate cytidylyltransferase
VRQDADEQHEGTVATPRDAAGPSGQASGGNAGSRPPGSAPDQAAGAPERRSISAGRNLPAAIGVGIVLGGLVIVTLFTVKATFLLYIGIMVAIALWEFSRALRSRDINLPLVPIAAGGIAMVTLAYWTQTRWAVVALALAAIGVLAWRLPGGAAGYVKDVTAGLFTLIYLPLMAIFVALMLAQADGARRALIFVVLTVCSDTGGYAAGVLLGKHPLAPSISPKKTWEGLTGSLVFCLVASAIMVPELLRGHLWQGLLLGLAAVVAATLGDLAESMIKRDLELKDMGHLLPGHGGIMDRIDSYLVMAPVIWLLLAVFVPGGHAGL